MCAAALRGRRTVAAVFRGGVFTQLKLNHMNRFDVAIAGGGLIGGSIALALARAGAKVAILDASVAGQEASWAGAGILSPAHESPEMHSMIPLTRTSLNMYPGFVKQIEEQTGRNVGFRPYGLLEVLGNDLARDERNAFDEAQREQQLYAEILTGEQAQELEPSLSPTVKAAILRPKDSSVDNRALTAAVLYAARTLGVEIYQNTPVVSILRDAGCALGLATKKGNIEAKWSVIAAGCFSSGIRGAQRYAPVIPAKGQMLALRCTTAAIRRVLMSEHVYLVPRDDGRILVGATIERVGFDRVVREDAIQKLLDAAVSLVPALKEREVLETWSGLRPDSPDHLPILGPVDVGGLLIATGHFRNGILLAPITAQIICEYIQTQQIDPQYQRFSPMRFLEA
jgi:glycine oxidase